MASMQQNGGRFVRQSPQRPCKVLEGRALMLYGYFLKVELLHPLSQIHFGTWPYSRTYDSSYDKNLTPEFGLKCWPLLAVWPLDSCFTRAATQVPNL